MNLIHRIKNHKYCKGCNIYEDYKCSLDLSNIDGKCPCRECIIKMVCTDSCQLLDDFYEDNLDKPTEKDLWEYFENGKSQF